MNNNNNLSRKSKYGTFNAKNEIIIIFFRVIHLESLISSYKFVFLTRHWRKHLFLRINFCLLC